MIGCNVVFQFVANCTRCGDRHDQKEMTRLNTGIFCHKCGHLIVQGRSKIKALASEIGKISSSLDRKEDIEDVCGAITEMAAEIYATI